MRDDHAHGLSGDFQVHVQRIARLAPAEGESEATHREHLAARDEGIAVRPVMARERETRDRLHAQLVRDVIQPVVDLLQSHGVGAAFLDDLDDALRILAPVRPAAAVHVVGSDAQRFRPELCVERSPVN
jgi:hypothetical protein